MRLSILEEEKIEVEKEIESQDVDNLKMRGVVLQKMAERQRLTAKEKLEFLGTCALQYAVSPTYKMKIDLTTAARPAANVYICKNNGIQVDPNEGGGGIIDVSSLSLRTISLESHEPAIDGPIIFDEPGKMLSKEYVPMLSEFLKKTSKDFDRQIIVVTHNDYLAQVADKKIRIRLDEKTNISHSQVE